EKKDVFERYGYNLPLRESEWTDMGGWDFLVPTLLRGNVLSPVDFIIFPEYNPALKTELKEISSGKAMFKIIRESFNFHKLGERGVDIAYNLVESAECFKLIVNDLNEAVAIISDLFSPDTKAKRLRG
ncbi:MAG: hypothetical protein HY097_07100, partial [Nitrospinae bacterium]|nr:hypothetical protein [Nitrospinota bacterium]